MRENLITLSHYRLEKALEDYKTAEDDYKAEHYYAVVNRAYYCVFHTMRALLILQGMDFKKHSAVISAFRKDYIKTGIFDAKLSDIIFVTSIKRGRSDYDDLIIISKDEAKQQLDNAKLFYDKVKPYIEKLIAENAEPCASSDGEPEEKENNEP